MKEERRKEALNACEKFFIESKWNFHTGLVTDLWLTAVEWRIIIRMMCAVLQG